MAPDLSFDDHGEPVPAVDFDFPNDEASPADIAEAQRELLKEALSAQYRTGKNDTLPAVLAALVDGHREPEAILSRIAGALWKTGILPLAAAAKLARKSTRQIRRAGEDFKFSMSLAHDRKP